MGACSSCVGARKERDLTDEDEHSRLLFDDAHTNQYGSFGDQPAGTVQADPQEYQRETDALQKVVAQTSNHLVDIFAILPQNAPSAPTTNFPAQDARLQQYQDVLSRISANGLPTDTNYASTDPCDTSDGWLSDEDELDETQGLKRVEPDGVPLLGGFADTEHGN